MSVLACGSCLVSQEKYHQVVSRYRTPCLLHRFRREYEQLASHRIPLLVVTEVQVVVFVVALFPQHTIQTVRRSNKGRGFYSEFCHSPSRVSRQTDETDARYARQALLTCPTLPELPQAICERIEVR